MSIENTEQKQTPWGVIAVIIAAIIAFVIYYFVIAIDDKKEPVPIVQVVEQPLPEVAPKNIPEIEPELIEPEVAIQVEEPIVEAPKILLPSLDDSDSWFTDKLTNLTWRKELLKLMVTEDMIRRFVVFTDNFSQGVLAYEHAPLVSPNVKFSAIEEKSSRGLILHWNEKNTQRFSQYVDLLRSLDSAMLVQWYIELKPLIDQAYQELGYPDDEFNEVLQAAITKVLDMEIPKTLPELDRPSVMYKYKNESLESLDDAEKLLLRLGKENLLVIKSVMLEINEKLIRSD